MNSTISDKSDRAAGNGVQESSQVVVALFEKKVFDHSVPPTQNEDSFLAFAESIRKNKALEEKLKLERQKANQSVLKSYKLKNG